MSCAEALSARLMSALVRDVARQGRLLTLLNRRETSARRMMILTGLQTTGKTTALKQLGRTHELRLRKKLSGRANDRIPVVYVSTPPKGSPRKLAAEFASRFLRQSRLGRLSQSVASQVSRTIVCQVG